MSDKKLDLSIVLPVYNEAENIDAVYREIVQAAEPLNLAFEIVFINDGSSDLTYRKLKQIQRADARVVVINFRRNFGQTPAMAAGFDYADGEVIITMDADRQNDPQDIPALLQKIDEGYDLVCGWRHQRQDGYWLRLLPSMIANKLISATTDVKLHDYGCTLKAFRTEIAKELHLYGEQHRFIPAIASWQGVSIAEIKVNHRPRTAGVSKYGISRTLRVLLDLITVKFLLSYSVRPLQFFGLFGLFCGGIGAVISLIMLLQRFLFSMPMADRPLLLLAILLIFIGLQFITVGLLAEMITRTYHESQRKPIYMVKEVLGRGEGT